MAAPPVNAATEGVIVVFLLLLDVIETQGLECFSLSRRHPCSIFFFPFHGIVARRHEVHRLIAANGWEILSLEED